MALCSSNYIIFVRFDNVNHFSGYIHMRDNEIMYQFFLNFQTTRKILQLCFLRLITSLSRSRLNCEVEQRNLKDFELLRAQCRRGKRLPARFHERSFVKRPCTLDTLKDFCCVCVESERKSERDETEDDWREAIARSIIIEKLQSAKFESLWARLWRNEWVSRFDYEINCKNIFRIMELLVLFNHNALK